MKTLSAVIILVVVIILVFLIYIKRIKSYPSRKPPKIAILIISAKSSRWNLEREVWKHYSGKFSNIQCFFIECNIIEKLQTLSLGCKENYIPGIYQKSLQALKRVGDDFDFYVRGNLSTFYIFDYLNSYLGTLPQNIPIYTGGKIWKNSFVSGTSIVFNRLARNVLIKHGFEKKYYDNNSVPDDVLISQVLRDHGVNIFGSNNKSYLYFWDYKGSYNYNLIKIKTHKNPFLRLKTSNLHEYQSISKKLLVEFYSS